MHAHPTHPSFSAVNPEKPKGKPDPQYYSRLIPKLLLSPKYKIENCLIRPISESNAAYLPMGRGCCGL